MELTLVMHSVTKYLSGHNQLIGGIVITNKEDLNNKLQFIQKTIGAVPSPFDCWLTLLGIKTLDVRMKKHALNAQAVAEFLEGHPKVSKSKLSRPTIPSNAQHRKRTNEWV